jgi:hypothetical protein
MLQDGDKWSYLPVAKRIPAKAIFYEQLKARPKRGMWAKSNKDLNAAKDCCERLDDGEGSQQWQHLPRT